MVSPRNDQETTMRFLSMIRVDESTGQVPSEQLMADMGKLIEELTRTGQLVSTAGLRPTAEGVRMRLHRRGRRADAALPPGARQRLGHRMRGPPARWAGVRRQAVTPAITPRLLLAPS